MPHEDTDIRSAESRLEQALVQLCGAADVVVDLLRAGIDRATEDAAALSAIDDAPWAQDAAKRIRDAIRRAEIDQHDREGKILLSLPDRTDHALGEWLRAVHAVDENSDWVIAATRYGLQRLRGLHAAVNEVGRVISGIDTAEARSWASRLSRETVR